MSEIDEDLKFSNLELSNTLGLTLTGNNPSIKHSGNGDLNILSNNGDITINSNNIMVEATNDITLQATSNNIFMNGGFVGNYETLSSNGAASLRTLTTFLNATNGSLDITLTADPNQVMVGQIKNFVFLTDGDNATHNVNISVSGIMFSTITLNTAGSTVSLLYTPLNIWSIIGGRIY